ncbi:aminopeptidase P N-terminal domain-containing protein [Ktedonospora formicarum]|uniref:Xaa-Pro aminopeptidase n=1 Tax=Ktedonospora formicarum TaxID=2778364 RepID=A0A8J3I632_9CHLR|nr:aminopeptidase P N-terminal domain-containing protein [Ktedonospora formicarum]GHO51017.1 Xaa-Pro aminopeptidase [Ktedonospora formicarum]
MFEARRKAFMDRMGSGVAILRSCPQFRRSGDSLEFTYRQDSNFYYLTGFEEPEAICVLAPDHPEHHFILFVAPRDPFAESWTGRRAGPEGAMSLYGADIAYPLEQFAEKVPQYLQGCKTLYYSGGKAQSFDEQLLDLLARNRRVFVPRQVADPRFILGEMRVRKSAEEIELIREASRISAKAYSEVLKALKPGMYEYEVQAILSYVYQQNGSPRHGYAPIVGAGANATIMHYDKNNSQMQDGELVLIDSACEYQYYSSDITRTYPINGRFTPAQRTLYELVLKALESATAMVKPGITLTDIHNHTVEILTTGMVELGILKGDVKQLIADKTYQPFYGYFTCHWMGLDVHDLGPYKRSGAWDEDPKLEPGMIFTIEPGIYIPAETQDVNPEFWNTGIRIEDDILVTEQGYENLTSGAPKTFAEIEALITHK